MLASGAGKKSIRYEKLISNFNFLRVEDIQVIFMALVANIL